MDYQSFIQLLQTLMTASDQTIRQETEIGYFNYRSQDPSDNFVDNMIQCIITPSEVSDFAAVLLRQDIDKNGDKCCFHRLSDESKCITYIDSLLASVAQSQSDKLLMVVAHWSVELMIKDIEIPTVFGFIQQAYQSEHVRVMAVMLVAQMVDASYSTLQKWPFNVFEFLQMCIQDQDHKVARYTIQAMAKILVNNDTTTGMDQKAVVGVMTMIMQRITQSIASNDEPNSIKMLVSLQDIIGFIGDSIIEQIPEIIKFLSQILRSNFSEEMKCQAVRIFLDITETISNIRKFLADIVANFLKEFILPNTSTVTEDDIQNWIQEENDLEYRAESLQALCEDTFESCSYTLGKQIIQPLLYNAAIMANKQPQNWRQLLCVLNAICFSAEGIQNVCKQKDIDNFCKQVLASQDNPNPRVRYAVLQTIGQLCTDFAPQIQVNHKIIMSCIMKLAQDPVSKVAYHAVAAAINFNSGLDYEGSYQYIEQFVLIMKFAWGSGSMDGQTNALTLLSSLCEVLDKEDLTPILQDLMPGILEQFQTTMEAIKNVPEFNKKQQEFITAILQAISMSSEEVPELFIGIAENILDNLMIIVQRSKQQEEHENFSSAFSAIQRLAPSCTGKMQSYINQLYPIITDVLKNKAIDVGTGIENEGEVKFNEHVISLQTAVFLALVDFLEKFPESFKEYFQELTTQIIDFNTLAMDGLTVARLLCMAQLVAVAHKCGFNVQEFHTMMFPIFMKEILPEDPTDESCQYDLEQVADCIDGVATYVESYLEYVKATNDTSVYNETIQQFMNALQYLEKSAAHIFKEEFEDLDGELEDLDADEQEAEIERLVDNYATSIESLGFAYSCFVSKLQDINVVSTYVVPTAQRFITAGLQTLPQIYFVTEGIAIFADIVEKFDPSYYINIIESVIPQAMMMLSQKPDCWILVQSVYYMIGQYILKNPASEVAKSEQCISFAAKAITQAIADGSDEALHSHDNLVSYLLFAGDATLQSESYWQQWHAFARGVKNDGEEVSNISKYLTSKLIQNDAGWMGRVNMAVDVLVLLFFGTYYSDIKNSDENKELVEQIRAIINNGNVLPIVQAAVQSGGSFVQKNYQNFTQ
ncbi:Importin beta-3 subunit [Spironucleus salmonicida]|uniref:Importin beta-3 subunit n=1 Tax=Spironucleus salmonicida TaxID=348837 RepID=V6LKJ9_9EUKA|nr:Importin beta-3 subunit [Spironucleus salmonicida]|eukprot:EST45097.1 Importin beta-3 subunit [Spironucleus salmonicida]